MLVKFHPDLLKRVEDFAKSECVDRMAAINTLTDRGLREPAQAPPSTTNAPTFVFAETSRTVESNKRNIEIARGVQFGPTPAKPGSRLKGTKK